VALQQALVRVGQKRGALGRRAGEDRDGLGPLALVAAEKHGRLAGVVVVVDGEQEAACVEINQCVGYTRQFFTKSLLGDDAAVLARSSGEEPASPRHRAGVASMAWTTTR